VLGIPLKLSAAKQTCALGAAIFAAVAAGAEGGGYDTVEEAQVAMTALKKETFEPTEPNQEAYDELYCLYRRLHDAFGTPSETDLSDVMKSLSELRDKAALPPS